MKHEESAIQSALCQHLVLFGVPGLVWFAVPNGGRRNAREGGRLKAEGVKAGVADMIFVHEGRVFALEIKSSKGRVSPAQIEWMKEFNLASGGRGFVVRGLSEALGVLELCRLIEPSEYHAAKDVEGSFLEAYAPIRERKAAGGPGWEPKS